MRLLQYAVVAYVRNPIGRFVEALRREVYPEHAHLPAHLTLLPPRCLNGPENAALETLGQICSTVEPFEVSMNGVESFIPVTPTVYIQVRETAKMRELHDRLNDGIFQCEEQWQYRPHLTIAKLATDQLAQRAFEVSRQRWAGYRGPRQITIDELTFVREGPDNRWIDLAPVPLGRALAQPRK
ncbi:MAG: 2'-5' RNA ligase family protein [Terriglobales bacterium]